MRHKSLTLFFLLLALVGIQIGLIFILFSHRIPAKSNKAQPIEKLNSLIPFSQATHYSYLSTKDFFEEAYAQGISQKKAPQEKPYGGIVPHHLLVKDKIAAFFSGLEKYDYDTIILIGPNHFSQGRSNIIFSKARWETPYGTLEPDLALIAEIESQLGATEEYPFRDEHSISALVSFIKKSFPKVKIMPVILKQNTKPEECEKLAREISSRVNKEKTLVLGSVDFSHYQPSAVADFHDLKSNSVIGNFDFAKIFDLELDSPQSVYALLKYLELNEAEKSELVFSTNSGRLMDKEDDPTTSHNIFYFEKGERQNDGLINMLFFGDLMLDRNVGKKIEKNGLHSLFSNLPMETMERDNKTQASKDMKKLVATAKPTAVTPSTTNISTTTPIITRHSFFQGIDLVGCNLEGAVTDKGAHYVPKNAYDFAFAPELIDELKNYKFNFFNLANNHFTDQGKKGTDETRKNLEAMSYYFSGCADAQAGDCSGTVMEISGKKVGLLGFSMVYHALNEKNILDLVSRTASSTDLVVINMHWGVEYSHEFNTVQQNLAHKIIDAGADMIIGHHPHVVQGMEIYNGHPIFYSLGNFIFDQYFSPDTQAGLALGLAFDKNTTRIFFYPLKSEASQVELMKDAKKEKFLEQFFQWSDIDQEYLPQIKNGAVTLK